MDESLGSNAYALTLKSPAIPGIIVQEEVALVMSLLIHSPPPTPPAKTRL
nr:hypothetical protein [Nonlabens ulvanivorans]